MTEIYVERWLTFHLADGEWSIALWVDSARPISAKVYRLTLRVPTELIGEAQATVGEERSLARIGPFSHGPQNSEHQLSRKMAVTVAKLKLIIMAMTFIVLRALWKRKPIKSVVTETRG